MAILINGTTKATAITVGNVVVQKAFARIGETGTWVLVFEKGGVTTVALWFGGNWKMNKVKSEIDAFFADFFTNLTLDNSKKVIIFPPACYLEYVKSKITSAYSDMVEVGIQTLANAASGAYTGQISAKQAADCGCTYALLGAGEVRVFLGVTDSDVGQQVKRTQEQGMKAIVCVGEDLEVRESGLYADFVKNQLTTILANTVTDASKILVVYEPLWAIGTGKTCTTEQLLEMTNIIRAQIGVLLGDTAGREVPVLYMGSMNVRNSNAIVNEGRTDGGVLGGASLTASTFASIINSTEKEW